MDDEWIAQGRRRSVSEVSSTLSMYVEGIFFPTAALPEFHYREATKLQSQTSEVTTSQLINTSFN
jgi:hypothetical protein